MKGQLYIEMLFTVLQTQNISVLLFIIVYGRISGRLYESCGVLKPRKKSFLMDENSEMPTHGCVPLCTKKIYRDKVIGAKISYLRFPFDKNLRKQWIHTMWRDLGKNFSTSNSNKVCSRHFMAEDFKTTSTHVVSLKPGVVPSIFAWKRSSPRLRSPPTPRLKNRREILIETLWEESLERMSIEIPSAISSSSSTTTTIDDRTGLLFYRASIREGYQNLWIMKTRLLHCYKTASEQHLANLFYISQSTCSRIFITRCNFMYLKLGRLNIWPSRRLLDETMPEDFKAKYPSTKVIIDCTEIRCEMPRSLLLNSELFSSYKHHTTSHRDR